MVGVDIGCGMEPVRLADKDVDPQMLDTAIHEAVPSGFNIHASAPRITDRLGLEDCKRQTAIIKRHRPGHQSLALPMKWQGISSSRSSGFRISRFGAIRKRG